MANAFENPIDGAFYNPGGSNTQKGNGMAYGYGFSRMNASLANKIYRADDESNKGAQKSLYNDVTTKSVAVSRYLKIF